MKATHTPGPWKQGKTNPRNVSANSSLICTTFHRGKSCVDSAEGNATLIAAAPELLEALEECAKLSCFRGDRMPSCDEWVLGVFAMARSAIAKAKGES